MAGELVPPELLPPRLRTKEPKSGDLVPPELLPPKLQAQEPKSGDPVPPELLPKNLQTAQSPNLGPLTPLYETAKKEVTEGAGQIREYFKESTPAKALTAAQGALRIAGSVPTAIGKSVGTDLERILSRTGVPEKYAKPAG